MEDGLVSSLEPVGRRDVSDGGVEPVVVVVVDEGVDFASGVVEGERRLGSVAFALERLMPSFDLAVALWVSGGDADMCHAECSDELFEVAGDELGSVVGDEARLGVGIQLVGALEDDLDVVLGHAFADLPVDDGSAVSVEDAAEVVERSSYVEVGDVGMPVLVGLCGLLEASAFGRRSSALSSKTSGVV